MINHEIVHLNDHLYDVLNGRGKVVGLDTNIIEVLFDNGRRLTFDANGCLNGSRRLFWQYPLLIDPPKDTNQWERIKRLIKAVTQFIQEG